MGECIETIPSTYGVIYQRDRCISQKWLSMCLVFSDTQGAIKIPVSDNDPLHLLSTCLRVQGKSPLLQEDTGKAVCLTLFLLLFALEAYIYPYNLFHPILNLSIPPPALPPDQNITSRLQTTTTHYNGYFQTSTTRAKMPAKIQPNENLWFLYICLQNSDMKSVRLSSSL